MADFFRSMHLSGTVVPMAAPTLRRGGNTDVDVPTLERFTNSLVDAGVDGLFPGSSIGEFPSFTRDQNREIVEIVAETAGDDTDVLAGCGDTSVEGVRDSIRAANAAGADAAVVVCPYYLQTTQDGLYRFFTTIAEQSELPVLIYNIPALTGHTVEVDTVTRLAAHDGIAGLKDTSGDLTYHHRAVEETPDSFAVFQGATELAVASLDLGADGLIAGPANVFPEALSRLYDAHQAHEHDEVDHLMQRVVVPLVTATSPVPTAAAIKHLVGRSGLDIGEPLAPLPTLGDDQRDTLDATYQRIAERLETAAVGQ